MICNQTRYQLEQRCALISYVDYYANLRYCQLVYGTAGFDMFCMCYRGVSVCVHVRVRTCVCVVSLISKLLQKEQTIKSGFYQFMKCCFDPID